MTHFTTPRMSRKPVGPTLSIVLGGAALATAITLMVLAGSDRPLAGLQISASLLLVCVAFATEHNTYRDIPWLTRPAIAISGSTLVASIATATMSETDYELYLTLWLALVAGMIFSFIFSGRLHSRALAPAKEASASSVQSWSILVLGMAVAAALFFFATQGVPALSGNVEQGRVDAAVEGTGYFRLVAYMAGPASIALVATRHRLAIPAVVTAAVIIAGMANRSPFLYLLIPLAFVLTDSRRFRLTTPKLLLVATVVATVILGFGTFRIFSQEEFAKYAEYQQAIASRDYLKVALTSLTHYAQVVPENQVLTSRLVDTGALPLQWGSTYLTLFISALPGEQLSPDRLIRAASGSSFVGGGTPPTLAGEGYMNFGLIGTFAAGFVVVFLLRFWADRWQQVKNVEKFGQSSRLHAALYGYFLCWVVGSPVAGLAGASTVPLAGAIVLVFLVTRRKGRIA